MGWPQNSMVVIDKETKEITYTDEFYLFKHLSHFVQPGDYHLASSKGKNHVAFKLKDGRIVVLLNNPKEESETVNIKVDEHVFSVEAKPNSINTIIVKN